MINIILKSYFLTKQYSIFDGKLFIVLDTYHSMPLKKKLHKITCGGAVV